MHKQTIAPNYMDFVMRNYKFVIHKKAKIKTYNEQMTLSMHISQTGKKIK